MYSYKLSKSLERKFIKMMKKNSKLFKQIMKKINEIINSSSIEHYKNLKHALSDYKRVRIGSFVLTFRFDKTNDLILFQDFEHHDKIYLRR